MAAELPVCVGDLGSFLRRLDAGRDRGPAAEGVKEGQLLRAEAEHRDAECLEQLRRGGDVEQRFRARADDERLGAGELAEVGRDVEPLTAVDASDPARGHEADPGGSARGERSARGRRPDRALNRAGGEVARPDLPRLRRETFQLGLGETDPHLAVEHADGRRQGPRLTDAAFGLDSDGHAFPGRKAVRDERRLERDHGLPPPERVRDVPGDLDHGIAPRLATQRAAASAASCGPPTRKPAASASPAPVVSTTSVGAAG